MAVQLQASLPATKGKMSTVSAQPDAPARARLGPLVARERLNLTAARLPQSVIATIQNARASSTRCMYDGKWRAFED